MNSQSPKVPIHDVNLLHGTGKCTVSGCGCKGYSSPPGGPDIPGGDSCIGKNSAGGTCNHTKAQHE
jgi:hypothetical protein